VTCVVRSGQPEQSHSQRKLEPTNQRLWRISDQIPQGRGKITIIVSVRDQFISYSGPADVDGPTVLLPVGRRNLPQHCLLHNEHHAKYTSNMAERMFSGTLRSAALVQVPNDFIFYDGAPQNSCHVELGLKPGFTLFDSRLAIVPCRSDEHVLGHRSHLRHFCSISGDRRKADDSGPQKHA
jgi:hypothetical protein